MSFIEFIICVWSLFRFRYVLRDFGDFRAIWGAELHNRVKSLAMDRYLPMMRLSSSFDTRYSFELAFQYHQFEVHLRVRSKVMLVLLKSGIPELWEEVVEDYKECRSTLHPWCFSRLMPEDWPSLFQDQFRLWSHHKLPKCPWPTLNSIYVFSKPLFRLSFYFIRFSLLD